jgi:hypothetical protein
VEPPSRDYRTFTSRARIYQVRYPANWRVYESSTTGVTIAPEGGVVDANGRAEVVYGAIVNHYEPFQNDRRRASYSSNLEEATDDLINQISTSSGYLRLVRGSGRRFTLDGGTALGATLAGTSSVTGLRERVTLVTRQLHDDHLVYMLFITPEQDASNYSRVLNDMVSSMRIDETHAH